MARSIRTVVLSRAVAVYEELNLYLIVSNALPSVDLPFLCSFVLSASLSFPGYLPTVVRVTLRGQ